MFKISIGPNYGDEWYVAFQTDKSENVVTTPRRSDAKVILGVDSMNDILKRLRELKINACAFLHPSVEEIEQREECCHSFQ